MSLKHVLKTFRELFVLHSKDRPFFPRIDFLYRDSFYVKFETLLAFGDLIAVIRYKL